MMSGSLSASFIVACRVIRVDTTVIDEDFGIGERDFDTSVRLREVFAADSIALPIFGNQRQIVVGAPSYVEQWVLPAILAT